MSFGVFTPVDNEDEYDPDMYLDEGPVFAEFEYERPLVNMVEQEDDFVLEQLPGR